MRKPTKLETVAVCILAYTFTYMVGLPATVTYLADVMGLNIGTLPGSVSAQVVETGESVSYLNVPSSEYTWPMAYADMANAQINPVKAQCLVKHESGENCNARHVNNDGSVDLGCYQWNDYWQIPGFLDLNCIGDLKCETQKFIEKVNNDGNFEAWYGFTDNCEWLGTNPFN